MRKCVAAFFMYKAVNIHVFFMFLLFTRTPTEKFVLLTFIAPHTDYSRHLVPLLPNKPVPLLCPLPPPPRHTKVCVVVPAQRAAALGLSHLPTHHAMPSRGSPPRDIHFTPLAQANASSGQHSGSGYPSHTRSHSHTPLSASGHGVGGGGGGVFGQHHSVPQVAADQQRHAISVPPHHLLREAGHSSSYGGSAHHSMHMPSAHQTTGDARRGRAKANGYPSTPQGGRSIGHCSLPEYERSKYEMCLPSTSYPPQGWSGDVGGGRGVRNGLMRSQSPPTMARSSAHGRSGGGAPRPPSATASRGYDNQYPTTRFSGAGGGSLPAAGVGGGSTTEGFSAGVGMSGRRHSGSSVMSGRASMRQEAIAAASHYYSVGDVGNEHAYDRSDYAGSYAGSSRVA